MKKFPRLLILITMLTVIVISHAFSQNPEVIISGEVKDGATGLKISRAQIFNIRSGETIFSDSAGKFVVHALRHDSLFFSYFGYSYRMISFKDSLLKSEYKVNVVMRKIEYELPNVNVFIKRNFETIQEESKKLGFNKNDYMLHGYEVLQSPITALWQQFSRIEKDKRGYAELMDTYRKNELLKEILQLYSEQGIIDVPDDEIDLFLDYCNISDEMLKRNTAYEIVMYMKYQVLPFERWLAGQRKK